MQRPRVVSLVPAATELICAAYGSGLLVGRSHECDYPATAYIQSLPILTSPNVSFTTSIDIHHHVVHVQDMYTIDIHTLHTLEPTHIIAQAICDVNAIHPNTIQQAIHNIHPTPHTLYLNTHSLQDVLTHIQNIANFIGTSHYAQHTVHALQQRIHNISNYTNNHNKKKVLFIERLEPVYIGGHWTAQLIELAGAQHPLNPTKTKEPSSDWKTHLPAGKPFVVDPQHCIDLQPDVIIISPCGLDIEMTKKELRRMANEKKLWLSGLDAFYSGNTFIVDGNQMFNRPGPRLVDALEFLAGIFRDNESLIPASFPYDKVGNSLLHQPEGARTNHLVYPLKLDPRIEKAHQEARDQGQAMYKDPISGLMVLTENFLKSRGYCCGNRCRHCPQGHVGTFIKKAL